MSTRILAVMAEENRAIEGKWRKPRTFTSNGLDPGNAVVREKRDASLDLLKTLLVCGMIFAHVVQLLGNEALMPIAAGPVSDYFNLITFSGFMLTFGMGVGLGGTGPSKPLLRKIRPAISILLATYISSLGFVLLVQKQPLSLVLLANLLSLRVLFGYSQFLATFFTLYLVIALARPTLVRISSKPWMLAPAIVICAAMTLVATSFRFPLLGTVISSTSFQNFPLASYIAWFLIGVAISLNNGRPRAWLVIAAAAATGSCLWHVGTHGNLPRRFPPSALYVFGPALILFGYVAFARLVARGVRIPGLLVVPGRRVLTFLVLSNLAIFAMNNLFGQALEDSWRAGVMAAGLIVAIAICVLVQEAVAGRNPVRVETDGRPAGVEEGRDA